MRRPATVGSIPAPEIGLMIAVTFIDDPTRVRASRLL
jgi:hypothetical protein